MKRLIPYALVGVILAVLTWTLVPAPTYTYVVRELAQTFTALQSFGAGLTATSGDITASSGNVVATAGDITAAAGNVNVATGSRVNLEGGAGDTYMLRDSDTQCWQQWKDGALGWQLCDGYAVPPECPADLNAVPLGGTCRQVSPPRIRYKGTLEAIP